MKARDLIAYLRAHDIPGLMNGDECRLLADLAEEGLASLRELVESECVHGHDGWWDTSSIYDGIGDTVALGQNALLNIAVPILDRAGAIERKEGEPHLVRFIEP